MKKIVLMFIVGLLSVSNAVGQERVMLANGTSIPVRITTPIDSKASFEQNIAAIVERNIYDDSGNIVLIRRGTPVVMHADIQKARGVGKPGSIKLTALTTTAVDGQTIHLMGGYQTIGQSKRGLALGVGVGVGVFVCWPCIFCLCIKGENVTISENTMLNNVVVNDTYKITIE